MPAGVQKLQKSPRIPSSSLAPFGKTCCLLTPAPPMNSLPHGLDTNIGENGLLLSGGERQKLGLVQGLLRNCKIILLDEVTSNVDRDSEEEIKNILLRLKEENGLTLISISHRMDFLKDTDRIVVLENGKIKESTSYEAYMGSQ